MSELNVTTLTNQDVQLCKAWVNFDGTLAAASMIQASYNVSSITDNGVGDYTVNFATAMNDVNYSITGTGRDTGGGSNVVLGVAGSSIGTLASLVLITSVRLTSIKTNDVVIDTDIASVQIFGN